MSSLTNSTIQRFRVCTTEKVLQVREEFKKYRSDSGLLKEFKKKYACFGRQSRNLINKKSKNITFTPYIFEWFEILPDEFTEEEQSEIIYYAANKIQGIFKHAQSIKTGICNFNIVNYIKNEEDTITICLTKNTLEASAQWQSRMIDEIKTNFPNKDVEKMVMVVSSRKVPGVTYCKKLDLALLHLTVKNDFKVIFCCSNSTRISDIRRLSDRFDSLIPGIKKNIRIIHDEAHNVEAGVPPNRGLIEYILIKENVLSYCPVTASGVKTDGEVSDKNNPIWISGNLLMNGFNYLFLDQVKSDGPEYSSCHDAEKHNIEKLKCLPFWKEESCEISRDLYKNIHLEDLKKVEKWSDDEIKKEIKKYYEPSHYKRGGPYNWEKDLHLHRNVYEQDDVSRELLIKTIIDLITNRKRELGFCSLMKQQKEKEGIVNGKNLLNMNDLLDCEFYKPNEFNLHTMRTPCRKIITRYLAEEALKITYRKRLKTLQNGRKTHFIQKRLNPLVLAIYGNEGNKYHLMYDCKEELVDAIMGDGEFNNKLVKLIKNLKSRNINTKRPLLIFGNYNPIGESISFAHTYYGTVRSVMTCTSETKSRDYQVACRGNARDIYFKKENPDFKFPEKFLIGPAEFIENALELEKENDSIVDYYKKFPLRTDEEKQLAIVFKRRECKTSNGIVATPIRIYIGECSGREELNNILKKSKRNPNDKKRFIDLLNQMRESEEEECTIEDKTGKFDWDNQVCIGAIRGYKKGKIASSYRYKKYHDKFTVGGTYINDKKKLQAGQCEILTCQDYYVNRSKDGTILHRNNKNVWWIGYKY